jgi:hypothetical protein
LLAKSEHCIGIRLPNEVAFGQLGGLDEVHAEHSIEVLLCWSKDWGRGWLDSFLGHQIRGQQNFT